MHIFTKSLTVIALGSALALTSQLPANAMPIQGIAVPSTHDVELVQFRHHRGGGWYRGHRGYRDYRPGYRRHGNYWYPLAAFGAGALIGGALAAPAARPSYGSRHVQWCSERYRTYDPSSDTYVPSAGVRARCVSPY